MNSVLVKPLFVNDMFNRSGKRMRAKFVKTVTCEGTSYDLCIKDSKNPENSYSNSADDKFYLRVLANGWLIPLGMTERELGERAVRRPVTTQMYGSEEKRKAFFHSIWENHSGDEADQLISLQIKKEETLGLELGKNGMYMAEYIRGLLKDHIRTYTACKNGTGVFPDFIGAALVDDLDNCVHLSNLRRQAYEEKQRAAEENEKKAAAEAAEKAAAELEAEIAAAKAIVLSGGTLTGSRMILALADRYHISTPIRTRGWIIKSFISCYINGSDISVRFWKKKGCACSNKIYDIIDDIRAAIQRESDSPEEGCP